MVHYFKNYMKSDTVRPLSCLGLSFVVVCMNTDCTSTASGSPFLGLEEMFVHPNRTLVPDSRASTSRSSPLEEDTALEGSVRARSSD